MPGFRVTPGALEDLKNIGRYTLAHRVPGHFPCFNFQVYTLLLLQVMNHHKQVARLEITFRPEHAHEALAQFVETLESSLNPIVASYSHAALPCR